MILCLILSFAGCKSEKDTASTFQSDYITFEEKEEYIDGNSDFTDKKTKSESDGDETVIISKKSSDKSGSDIKTEKTYKEPEISKSKTNCKHKFSDATCTKPQKCIRCGAQGEPSLGHSADKQPTCTENSVCTRCGAIVKYALGHFYRKGVCTRCGAAEPKGTTAIFLGDSICYGTCDSPRPLGWAGRIERDHGIRCDNVAEPGWTLSERCNAIYTQFQNAANDHYDYVIMHGGYNDVFRDDISPMITLGEVTSQGTVNFDLSTAAGGLEKLFSEANRLYPTAKKGFIINYFTEGSIPDRFYQFVPIAKQICDKWGIKYLYLDEIDGLYKKIKSTSPDWLHPSADGYEVLTPYIYDWMMTL